MSKKRLTAIILVLVLAVSVLAGCSSKDSNTDQTTTTATTRATTQSAQTTTQTTIEDEFAKYMFDENKTYTISWCVNELNAPVDPDATVKKMLEERFNVEFDIWYVDRSNREELLNIRFTSGDFPDVLSANDNTAVSNYHNQGLIAEIQIPVIERLMPKTYADILTVHEMEGITPFVNTIVGGINYGIPVFSTVGKYHYSSLWRQDWLDALGITKLPETLDEFETAFYEILNNKQVLIDSGLTNQRPENIFALSSGRIREPFASIYGAFGYIPYYWAVKNDEFVYGAVQPEMKEALAYLSKWYKDGILNPEFITGENRGDHWSISHDFIEGRIAYTNNAPFYQNMPAGISLLTPNGGRMYRAFTAVNAQEAMADGRPPIGPRGDSGSIIWGTNVGKSTVFAKALENEPDKLGRILTMVEELGTNFDDFILLSYGIENEHWVWSDGIITSILSEGDPYEKHGLVTVFFATSEALGMLNQLDPGYYEYADEVANYSNDYKNALLGIKLPSYDIYWDELDKLQKEVYNNIITGRIPLDDFDKFVADWMRLGGEILTREANEWYASTKLND